MGEQSIFDLIAILREGTEHLVEMAKRFEFPWEPTLEDPRKLHNMYVRNLITAYVSKFSDLSNGTLLAIENQNYLMYAVCGRALLETTAILRYYVLEEYKPLLDKGGLDAKGMQRLIELDDQHLRGGKFDWESFLFRRYSKLKDDAAARLKNKGKGKSDKAKNPGALTEQVRIGRCVESWGHDTPGVLVIYNLFCDLVHPNLGSTFLVASASGERLYFSRFRGTPVGQAIFEQSFPMLLSVTHRPFGDYLTLLIATMWQDAELVEP